MKHELIKIQSLSKVYGGAHPVYALKGVNLSVKKGSVYGIIGTSGAGKSTLLRCVTGLDRPTSGEILIDGEDPVEARQKFGMIFQHFNLFSFRTVLENIMYPLEIVGVSKSEARKRALELIHLVKLQGKENSYPGNLSGGEKQRVAIARALARNPILLFSDEATSALDPPTKKAILSLQMDLNKTMGLTIFLITHEMEVIKQICTDVAVLEHGEIVEQGKVEDLFSAPKHPTTKKFLQSLHHDDLPDHVFNFKDPNQELLWLYFKGEGAKEPIISRLVKNFQIEVNILLGDIDALRTTIVGRLLLSLKGEAQERRKAHMFLEENGVMFEVVNK